MFRFVGIQGHRNAKSRTNIDRKERLLTSLPHTDAEGRVTFGYTRVLGLFFCHGPLWESGETYGLLLRKTYLIVWNKIYTECPGGNVPDFGRMFLKLKYTDTTKNTYIRSWTVTEIMVREKCDHLEVPRTVPGSRDVLPVHCACPSCSLQPTQAYSCCDCTCKVLGTLRTTATLVRVFM